MSPSDQIVPLVVALIVLCFIIIAAGFGMLFFAYKFAERNEEYYSSTETDFHADETVKVEAPQIDPQAVVALKHTRPEIPVFRWPAPQLTVKRPAVHRNLES
jgi:hypothetical protein